MVTLKGSQIALKYCFTTELCWDSQIPGSGRWLSQKLNDFLKTVG